MLNVKQAMASTTDATLFYLSLLFIWFLSSYLFQTLTKRLFSYRTGAQHPPSPPALPIVGHLHLLVGFMSFPKILHSIATRYGPLLHIRFGASEFILVSSANFAKEILKTHELNFVSRPPLGPTPDYDIYSGSDFVFSPYDTYWRFLKKLCMTRLLSTSQLNQFLHIREQEIAKLLQSLTKISRERESCDISAVLTTMTNNIICRMAISTSLSDNASSAEKIKKLVAEIVVNGGKFSAGDVFGPLAKYDLFGYGRKLRKALEKFDQLIEEILKKHEDENETTARDVMDILLETCNDPSAEVKLTRKDIKAFLLDIIMAGTETTASAVKWAMAELINHPQDLKKLREEIYSVVGEGRLVKESDVQNLPYLKAVVKETLRLHPPSITTIRQSNEDCKINGYYLKAKSRIIINLYSIMRDPSSWNDPDEFIPERFMVNSSNDEDDSVMEMKAQNGFEYLPFGSGRRSCPGTSLALSLLHATIGALVQCFDWEVKGGGMVDMREASGFAISMEMATPLVCYPLMKFNPLKHGLDGIQV